MNKNNLFKYPQKKLHKSVRLQSMQNGFIALITSVIISTLLLGLLVSSGSYGLSTRVNTLNRELKLQSQYLADSCTNTALLSIVKNPNYIPGIFGDKVFVGSNQCIIDTVTYTPENSVTHIKNAEITVHAAFRDTWTTRKTSISITSQLYSHAPAIPTITILSQEEI